jgi:hypothetical protein
LVWGPTVARSKLKTGEGKKLESTEKQNISSMLTFKKAKEILSITK